MKTIGYLIPRNRELFMKTGLMKAFEVDWIRTSFFQLHKKISWKEFIIFCVFLLFLLRKMKEIEQFGKSQKTGFYC